MAQDDPTMPDSAVITGGAIAPELVNREQEDEAAQTQTLAGEAIDGSAARFGLSDTEKVGGGIDDIDTPDLVDHMHQMVTSGRIDMSAYRGERNDDEEDESLGPQGIEDGVPYTDPSA
jgi:hypothetical protein